MNFSKKNYEHKKAILKKPMQIVTVITLFIITACGCSKISDGDTWNPELPPITQTGANTFGCKINGVVMIPRDSRKSQLGGIPTGVEYLYGGDTDWIEASDKYTSTGGVAIKIPNLKSLKIGEYEVKTIIGGFAPTHPDIVYIQAIHHQGFYGSIEGTGKIIITRYDDEVISGTFYCRLKNRDISNNYIEITEGRFDFNKKTINTTRFR
ncbi:hypothetical protein KCTC32516_01577 [Polaribacter huanghezhanensis]|uniref:hypothetical protein n=1 Tax=Polaribacter huanghezhanensis TaxID=1354726 RepID=UPI00264A3F42|nr:hypothetical protein [Polaribacter huanghezhanensis]WKD86216.1 hypothetical protein KCTC32516_01577 [Polaribacter huanghezhanensis]